MPIHIPPCVVCIVGEAMGGMAADMVASFTQAGLVIAATA